MTVPEINNQPASGRSLNISQRTAVAIVSMLNPLDILSLTPT
jgi:hypothetical protein